jgi:hypothetical protein
VRLLGRLRLWLLLVVGRLRALLGSIAFRFDPPIQAMAGFDDRHPGQRHLIREAARVDAHRLCMPLSHALVTHAYRFAWVAAVIEKR